MNKTVVTITKRAHCFAAFAAIVQCYETQEERLRFITRLREHKIISPMSADLLIEELGLASA